MDNFQIETAQNVSISQKVAGVGERILAYLIDGLVLSAYMVLTSLLLGGMGLGQAQMWVFVLIIGLPPFLYFLLWETFWNGQTPGKAALDLRVVNLDGGRPVFSDFLIRWLLRILDITLSSGSIAVVTILLNGKGQRLGDMAARTTVISEKKELGLDRTLLIELPEDYEPIYPQVSVLSDRDVQDIKNIYHDARKYSKHNIIEMLASKVSELLSVTPQQPPQQFVEQVLKDYNYYTQKI